MKKIKIIFIVALFLMPFLSKGQAYENAYGITRFWNNVGIATRGTSIFDTTHYVLQIGYNGLNKGMILPMASTSLIPIQGGIFYSPTDSSIYYSNGFNWTKIGSGGSSIPSLQQVTNIDSSTNHQISVQGLIIRRDSLQLTNSVNMLLGSSIFTKVNTLFNSGNKLGNFLYGYNILQNDTIPGDNVLVGMNIITNGISSYGNASLGSTLMTQNNTSYNENVAVGSGIFGNSGIATNNNVSNNVGIGSNIFSVGDGGSNNIGIGNTVFQSDLLGSSNIGIGIYTLRYLNSYNGNNIGIGSNSLEFALSVNNTIAIGNSAGMNDSASSYNIYLGNTIEPLGKLDNNEIVIGNNQTGFGSNTVSLGNNSTVGYYFPSLKNYTQVDSFVTTDVTGKLTLTPIPSQLSFVVRNINVATIGTTLLIPSNASKVFIVTKMEVVQTSSTGATTTISIGYTSPNYSDLYSGSFGMAGQYNTAIYPLSGDVGIPIGDTLYLNVTAAGTGTIAVLIEGFYL